MFIVYWDTLKINSELPMDGSCPNRIEALKINSEVSMH